MGEHEGCGSSQVPGGRRARNAGSSRLAARLGTALQGERDGGPGGGELGGGGRGAGVRARHPRGGRFRVGQVQQACQVSRRGQRQHTRQDQLVCYHSWKVVTPYNKQILLKSHDEPFEGFQVV